MKTTLTKQIRIVLAVILLTGLLPAAFLGCAHVAPGQDPLIVRAEQAETVAANTFNLVVTVDDANRPFFIANVPEFHKFAEWLRQPVFVDGTNQLPQGLAIVKNLDNVKLSYKSAQASSNVFFTTIIVLESTVSQAAGWLSKTTNSIPH